MIRDASSSVVWKERCFPDIDPRRVPRSPTVQRSRKGLRVGRREDGVYVSEGRMSLVMSENGQNVPSGGSLSGLLKNVFDDGVEVVALIDAVDGDQETGRRMATWGKRSRCIMGYWT